jgi:sec-independent protein translocase protein TatA
MSLGPAEILVVLVIALIVFGPKRLPEVGRQVGAAMRELRRVQDTVRAEIDQALQEPEPAQSSSSSPAAIEPAAIEPPEHSVPAEPPDEPGDGFARPQSFS